MSTHPRIPISVRITQEDADFIAALDLDGAHTPSEKIRVLLTQARLSHASQQDFAQCLQQTQSMLVLSKRSVANWEKNHFEHSALLTRTFEILPDLYAYVASESPDEEASLERMKQYEFGIASRLIDLIESVLQLAVTGNSPCYDRQLLTQQLDTTLALAKIILQQKAPL